MKAKCNVLTVKWMLKGLTFMKWMLTGLMWNEYLKSLNCEMND